jgi:hypothetical protein
MLRNGFIDENYADYINYFHPNSISKDEISHVNGILLANNLHPRITDNVIDLMNQSAAQITYSKQTVNDFISLLSR